MKKSTLLLMLMQAIVVSMYAQTTNFGNASSASGYNNSHFGYWAGLGGGDNSFFGHLTGTRSTAGFNTAMGSLALTYNTSGFWNTAMGAWAMQNNTTGIANVAIGYSALNMNTLGYENTAIGVFSLNANSTGYRNTANGYNSLASNTTGHDNVVIGNNALFSSTIGAYNTVSGGRAMYSNTSGIWNTATGYEALSRNTTGYLNSTYGSYSLINNTSGWYNSAFGYSAGPSGSDFNNTTSLGWSARPTASNQVRIGNTSVTSIGGQVSWTTLSDGRFKRDLKEDVAGLAFINKLRPVSYSVDNESINKFLGIPDSISQQLAKLAKKNVRQSGFVAQEVEAVIKKEGYVFHGVEAPQNENDHYGIRYAEFVVPLVKAVQELTAKIEQQEKVAEEQKKEIDVLKQQLKLSSETKEGEIISKSDVSLYQNNPNPFSIDTEISMSLPETTRQATLIVYTMEGKQLKVIPIHDRGKAVVKIEANELKPGMYLYSLIVDGKVLDTKRMILTGN